MNSNPRRFRMLGVPALLWILLPVPLLIASNLLPKYWPPQRIEEPLDRSEIFREPVFIAKDGAKYRVIPAGESTQITPIWAIGPAVHSKYSATWNTQYFIPSLFQKNGTWNYEMMAYRFDPDWQSDKKHEFQLSQQTLKELHPQIIQELNKRSGGANSGNRLQDLLDHGTQLSTMICPQNVLVLLTWFSMGMAGLTVIWLLFRGLWSETPEANS